jgi:uncharacterized protein (TIGR02001 family)
MKKSIVLATAVATVLTSGVASADFSGNAAVASNYIWRGISQTQNQAAGQGGLDWSNDSGFYVGTWVSNVDFTPVGQKGYEMDVYAGFSGEAGSIGYDLGVISYQYPMEPQINFTEVYVSGTASIVTVGVSLTVDAASGNADAAFDSGDIYINGSLDYTVGKSDVSVYAGSYMFDADGTGVGEAGDINYSHFGASISKDGFTFAVDKNDTDAATNPTFGSTGSDNVRFTVSYGVDFEL